MNKIYMFPTFTGNYCVADKNAVLCNVSELGEIQISSKKRKSGLIKHENICFWRGIEYLIFASIAFFKGLYASFVQANKSDNKTAINAQKAKLKTYLYVVLLIIFALSIDILVLGVLPTYLGFHLITNNTTLFLKNLCIALVKCLTFYLILVVLYLIPSVKRFYKFNSAGNIILNQKGDLLCGHRATNYLNFIVFSLLISYFVVSLISLTVSPWIKPLLNFVIVLLCFAVSYEFLLLLDTKLRKYKQITLFTSWLVNSKPAQTEMQTAQSALSEGLLMMEYSEREEISECTENHLAFSFVYAEVKQKLLNAGIDDQAEVDWLLAIYLDVPKLELKFISTISKQEYKEINKLVNRRIQGEPIAKIFGFTEFYGLNFKVNKDVLTPRQETEILVENAIKIIKTKDKDCKVLDLCTGSGAIAVTLAKNTNANVWASDVSNKALLIAEDNAKQNDVEVNFIESNLFSNFKKKKKFYDMIVSNPPYIKTDVIPTLQKEVKEFDPILALDGGIDGLYFYKRIAEEAPYYLTSGGYLILEIGEGQANQVKKLLTPHFNNIKIIKDYNNINRVVIATKI